MFETFATWWLLAALAIATVQAAVLFATDPAFRACLRCLLPRRSRRPR